jgi:low affinity Fe/Cu permease
MSSPIVGASTMSAPHRKTWFSRLADTTARGAGRPATFAVALSIILLWAVSGPLFGFSDTWQLVVNTGTTIITFLMVFLIQHTQNRDSEAMHVKVDELIRATRGAHNALLDLEDLEIEELDKVRSDYEALARKAREKLTTKSEKKGTKKQANGTPG